MPDSDIQSIEINPPGHAQASVIWLHGLGADGHDFEPMVAQLGLVEAHAVRFVLPHAPVRAVSVNGGQHMCAWFDIRTADLSHNPDNTGIRESEDILRTLIAAEVDAGIACEKIVLAGFSQGGAIALQAALRYPQRLAGVLALSTLLPLATRLPEEAHAANRDLPIFMAHGSADQVIPLALAQRSREQLALLGYAVAWHEYPMPHAVCPQEVADIRAALVGMLGL